MLSDFAQIIYVKVIPIHNGALIAGLSDLAQDLAVAAVKLYYSPHSS